MFEITGNDERRPPLPVGAWVVALGAVGFGAGFFGPMALRPEANQGPMLGLFITGPGGALLGLLLGVVFRLLPVSNTSRIRALIAAATGLGLGTLFYCLPPPETMGILMESTVRDCRSPADLAAAGIREWEQRVANAPWARVRPGWKQEVPGLLRSNGGVVLTLAVTRENRILEHRKPWNAGRVDAEGWRSRDGTPRRYFVEFAGPSCTGYAGEMPVLYVRQGQGSGVWPPDDLPNLLGVAVAEPVPYGYLELSRRGLRD